MGLIKEFKDFIIKGNAIDMAVGIIIGAAFGGVVKSLVDDVLMPPIGYVMGGVDFSAIKITLAEAVKAGETHPITQQVVAKDLPAVSINVGLFINALIALIIQGFAIFMVVKMINSLKRKSADVPAPEAPPADVQLLTEIRDLMKARG
ncbi:MAG: large-conductance mechanosensitive channel protein MscL [Planctomycetales bacterium]|nr:large-conductance mechanosensitive channel protein MscL [Planctomycetales bacterium]